MELARALYDHAYKHYNKKGWDFLVECWSLQEIHNELQEQNITKLNEAIKHFSEVCNIQDERRKGAKASW